MGHRERLRQRAASEGLDGFDDHQVLELLLFYVIPRADTNPLAHLLIGRFGSLAAVLDADPGDLATVPGIGPNAARFLALIPQVTRRYCHDHANRSRPELTTSETAATYVAPLMAGRCEEVFYVICLDVRCRVLHAALVSEGTVKSAHVEPRHVVEAALRHRAASVLLAHNHPQGTATPTADDRQLTDLLTETLRPLGIRVVDHLIVAGPRVYSLARGCELRTEPT
jgi:DNA repair protein RadC